MVDILTNPMVIVSVVLVVLFVLDKLSKKSPFWKSIEGTIIAGIRYAEKAISDDTEDKGKKKFDAALQHVLSVYDLTEKQKQSVAEGIPIKHTELELLGQLNKSQAP